MDSIRTIFMGTPDLARACLQALLESPVCQIVAVVTQPDRPKGRDLKLQSPPVKTLALQANVPVFQPEKARNEEFIKQLREAQPDLIAVAAFGQILPQSILDIPRFGCLNVHTSLLPKYRGAAPIQSAIVNGEAETGVTIMKMDAGMDTGAIVAQERTPIQSEDTAETLHDRLAGMGARLMVQTIPDWIEGRIRPLDQPAEGVSYAPKIKKTDGQIDWNQTATAIWHRVRGLVPWPGAFTHISDQAPGDLLKIWKAEVVECAGIPGEILQADKSGIVVGCGQRALRVQILQREGGRRLTAAEFLAGHPLPAGMRLA